MHVQYAEGPLGSGKTRWLCQQLSAWPASPGHWLILASNSSRKALLEQRLRQQHPHATADRSLYTYSGWVRTILYDHWPRAEQLLTGHNLPGHSVIIPELSSYRDSEQLLTFLVDRLKQKDPNAFAGFPAGQRVLIRQLIRRLRQRSENRLTREQMKQRSEWLAEPCVAAVSSLERSFDHTSYSLRMLDPSKQLDLFHQLLKADTDFLQWMRQRVQYLAVDDWDETHPAQHDFIRLLDPERAVITCDPEGGSRRGYLNAYPYDWQALKERWPGPTHTLKRSDVWYGQACRLLQGWKQSYEILQPEPTGDTSSLEDRYDWISVPTPHEQTQALLQTLERWMAEGYTLGQIAIACPELTPLSQYTLKTALTAYATQWLSGTETPWQHPVLRIFVLLVQWLNMPLWQTCPLWDEAPLTSLECRDILRFWRRGDMSQQALTLEQLNQHPDLGDWHQFRLEMSGMPIEKQLLPLFRRFVGPYADPALALEPLTTLIQRYHARFIRMRPLFEPAQHLPVGLDWVVAIKQGLVADTPKTPLAINPDTLVLGTPQKLIDAEVHRPCYIWLDIASADWHRTDNAPLYNAWVHSAAWKDGLLPELAPAGMPQDEWLLRLRAGHITRNLMLLVGERLTCIAPETDWLQRPQTGLLPDILPKPALPPPRNGMPQLRPDQQPVLGYTGGTMAISAVPGAGKTFVTTALILHLIQQQNIQPERILVLTYMDSAAKNLTHRLRPYLGSRLPQVSTIHSLAYRIVRHGNHAMRLGLDVETLNILDDITQQQGLLHAAAQTHPADVSVNTWADTLKTGLNRLKANGLGLSDLSSYLQRYPDDQRVQEFLLGAQAYNAWCDSQFYLDFNDLIQLSIRLLTEHEDIRQYYQQQIDILIEDEAQDSSAALQQLLRLLGGDKPNLIRTGDTNQSITTTFSAADPQVFRQFTQTADRVVTMDGSGRCAQEVMDLANQWISLCQADTLLQHAFVPIHMQPVSGFNPACHRPVQRQVFETVRQEEDAILNDIRQALRDDPSSRKALLIRTNFQAGQWMSALAGKGIACVSSAAPPLFEETTRAVFAWVRLLRNPEDPERLVNFLNAYGRFEPAASDLLTLIENKAMAVHQLQTLPHSAAVKLYYDWRDCHRLLVSKGCWLLSTAQHLFSDPRAQQVVYTLSELVQAQLGALPDGSGWLCEQQEVVCLQLRNQLKRLSDGDIPEGHLLVTTLHTSKGQEYDWVWIPELTAQFYPFLPEHLKNKERDSFQLEVSLARLSQYTSQPRQAVVDALRLEKLEEEARLLYVGITRARKSLWLSGAQQGVNRYGKPLTLVTHPLLN